MIRGIANVVGMRPGRIRVHSFAKAGIVNQVAKHPLRSGRTANIAHADKQNTDFGSSTTHSNPRVINRLNTAANSNARQGLRANTPIGNGGLYVYLKSHSFDRIRAMSKLLPTLLLLAALLPPGDVAAHGSVTPEDDLCIMRIGYYQAHFKIYLPATRGHQEYCEDIPDTGETIFIMEYEHSGLADVPIDFRIIRNTTGQGIFTALEDVQAIDDLESVTVIHHDAAIQRDVFTIMYDFQEQGEFVGIVNVRNPDTGKVYTAVFPFEVGFAGLGWWPWFVLIAVFLQLNYLWLNGTITRWQRHWQKQPGVVVDGLSNG